jgi:preprotein translocase subunit SecE
MATMTDEKDETETEKVDDAEPQQGSGRQAPLATSSDGDSGVPQQLGVQRYVLAGFFAAGMAVAFLVSKVLVSVWNRLADNAWVATHASFLNRIGEDDRGTWTMLAGALVGVWATIYAYRRDDLRTWTNEVASELAKVTWPDKKEVTNSTVVVILASAFATVFLALLDRFWGFVTNLVYGT